MTLVLVAHYFLLRVRYRLMVRGYPRPTALAEASKEVIKSLYVPYQGGIYRHESACTVSSNAFQLWLKEFIRSCAT